VLMAAARAPGCGAGACAALAIAGASCRGQRAARRAARRGAARMSVLCVCVCVVCVVYRWRGLSGLHSGMHARRTHHTGITRAFLSDDIRHCQCGACIPVWRFECQRPLCVG
jgi:hypothetical protein